MVLLAPVFLIAPTASAIPITMEPGFVDLSEGQAPVTVDFLLGDTAGSSGWVELEFRITVSYNVGLDQQIGFSFDGSDVLIQSAESTLQSGDYSYYPSDGGVIYGECSTPQCVLDFRWILSRVPSTGRIGEYTHPQFFFENVIYVVPEPHSGALLALGLALLGLMPRRSTATARRRVSWLRPGRLPTQTSPRWRGPRIGGSPAGSP